MFLNSRTPAFAYPAGQTVDPNAASNYVVPGKPVGVDATGTVVDGNGNPVTDSGGNVLTAPVSTPTVVSAAPVSAPVNNNGAMLFSVLITVAVVGGAAYAGSYFGTKSAGRSLARSRRTT